MEEEIRLNIEYADFLEFEFKVVGRLKRDEPTVSTSSINLADDFSRLLEAAKEKDQELRDAGELSDEPSGSSLGSDYDFLDLPRKNRNRDSISDSEDEHEHEEEIKKKK